MKGEIMEDIIKVCALGGLDENGRDCYVIEINNDIFVLDAGSHIFPPVGMLC